eukprot:TRINITY_DN11971_c0_g1_i1.p1 TRINITY_DN11971_c0_g1~~TRINITY_DN11971_c0_g1_i1.p1  ORF type:complete len:649 (+),score=133.41 TRINITY_DN11971_c0_g1_i1:44-1990(+)
MEIVFHSYELVLTLLWVIGGATLFLITPELNKLEQTSLSNFETIQRCASFANLWCFPLSIVLSQLYKGHKKRAALVIAACDLTVAINHLLTVTHTIPPIFNQNRPVYALRYLTWGHYLVTVMTAILPPGLSNYELATVAIPMAISPIFGLSSQLVDPSVRWIHSVISVGAMCSWLFTIEHLLAKGKGARIKDMQMDISDKSYEFYQWQSVLVYPTFPLVVALKANGLIDSIYVEVVAFVGELLAKGGYIVVLASQDAIHLKQRTNKLQSVVQGMVKAVSRKQLNIEALTQACDRDVTGDTSASINDWLMAQFAGVETDHAKRSRRSSSVLMSDSSAGSARETHVSHRNLALRNWEFESLDMSSPQLITFCVDVLMDLNVDEALHVNRVTLTSFVKDAKKMYNDVPFHNFQHAVLVFHTTYMFVLTLDACWSPLECAAVLLASLCHDLDHRGLNNAYHVATMSELAVRYNDQSVLENHHCSKMFELLRKHKLLAQLSREDVSAMRKTMIDIIMGTDMTRHAAQLAKMESSEGAMLADNEDTRRFLLVVIVHSADLYNAIKPFASSQRWTTRLYKEFNLQCDLERSLGMEPAAFMTASTPVEIAKGQQAFYNYVVIPWFHQVTRVMPDLAFLSKACADNLAEYSKRIEPA